MSSKKGMDKTLKHKRWLHVWSSTTCQCIYRLVHCKELKVVITCVLEPLNSFLMSEKQQHRSGMTLSNLTSFYMYAHKYMTIWECISIAIIEFLLIS